MIVLQKIRKRPSLAALRSIDRKSTRLNSSHPSISYAVFCLKKKNARVALAKVTAAPSFGLDCVMGLRLGLKSSWHQPAAAGQGELGDTFRAYTPSAGAPFRR